MKIAAFDLSLTATGWATYESARNDAFDLSLVQSGTFRAPKGMTGMERIDWVLRSVLAAAEGADVIVFEGASYASRDPSAFERAGLAHIIQWNLWPDYPWYLVAPMSLKKFVADQSSEKGESIKKEHMMLAIFQRFGHTAKDNNEADALGLLYVGLGIAGVWRGQNAYQRTLIEKIKQQHGGQ